MCKIDSVKSFSSTFDKTLKNLKVASRFFLLETINLKLRAKFLWKVFEGEIFAYENIIFNTRSIQKKGKFNFDRTNNNKRRGKRRRKKKKIKYFPCMNFQLCIVILNCVTSDELSIREPLWTSSACFRSNVFEAKIRTV